MATVYDFTVLTGKGENKPLSDYKGNVLLVVNVASKCGFTPQYAGLEKLYRTYKERGLRILAFPCNDFGGQEPGTLEEIEQFCSVNYGVTFDIFDKVHCVGGEQHPLYRWLTSEAEPEGEVKWNFEKFLIDREGRIAGRFRSNVAPEDAELTEAIEHALNR